MRLLSLLLLIPLWLGSSQPALSANVKDEQLQLRPNNNAKLLVLGDSLSAAYRINKQQGWVNLLRMALQDSGVEVINGAISGDTTSGGLARLPTLLKTHQPTHVLIELGGNDGLQGYPINEMKQNIASMITLVQKSGAVAILQQMQIPTNYGKRYTQMFIDSYEQISDEFNVPLLPFLLAEIATDPELMQADGIHPTQAAQPLIRDFMLQHLTPLLNAEAQNQAAE